ncbi:cell division protein ZapA [Aestuariivirga litoralis]|uniref:Cell division protein ZapA n=2 Tax=Aestuariivirga litoralis TaxID=2650924 RepID=A0A2W2BQS0_9HYPH|nr:cell division protein ZapA [Aestuariivirga litoralis]
MNWTSCAARPANWPTPRRPPPARSMRRCRASVQFCTQTRRSDGMAHVIVQVNGRPYTMQCPEGEEAHLRDLAELLDSEVQRVKTSVGNVGDIRMLVMAGLMVADRLSEAITKIQALEEQVNGLREAKNAAQLEALEVQASLGERLMVASERLEVLAQHLGK